MNPLVLALAGAMLVFSLTVAGAANATIASRPMPTLHFAEVSAPADKELMTQLEADILPQLETILTPQQIEQFNTGITNGISFRKAFKSLLLTSNQKAQLKTLLNSVPKKNALASLTPEQKKQLFSKKELFSPTSDEISDRIDAALKAKGASLPEGVKEKIDAGIKKKNAFIPSPETITEKIKAGMNGLKEKMQK